MTVSTTRPPTRCIRPIVRMLGANAIASAITAQFRRREASVVLLYDLQAPLLRQPGIDGRRRTIAGAVVNAIRAHSVRSAVAMATAFHPI